MRKPARLERAGALTPRDRIWAAIRSFGNDDHFSVAEIMVLSEQRADTVLSYMGGLEQAGYITWVGARDQKRPAARPRREFRRLWLKRDVGAHAPRVTGDGQPVEQGVGREHMWNWMRRQAADFSWRDLAHGASTRQHQVAGDEAQTYIRYLAKAGYLQLSKQPSYGTKGTPARYRFLRSRDTGPRAPLITGEKQVLDGNTGHIVYDPTLQLQGGEHDS